ncbi:MAG TPA: lytic transglycosylase domain-containing protein [Rhizomicrobium sp.]|nr:lytic transglycosylase domain-containing protein [Rhizomicrobium sp.]
MIHEKFSLPVPHGIFPLSVPTSIAGVRDRFSSFLHLVLALAFLPMAAFLISPHKAQLSHVVNVVTQWTGSTLPSDGIFAREATMSRRELLGRWDPLIAEASRRFGVSADWIRAVMRVESGGRTVQAKDRPITSQAGAVGVMQVMPATYDEMRRQYRLGTDPYNPHDNIFAGAAYLHWLHGRYGFPQMFAAYNGGPGTLEAYLRGTGELPKETQNYVASVTSILDSPKGHRHRRFAGLILPARAAAAP